MKRMTVFAVVTAASLSAGCGSYESQVASLDTFAGVKQISSSPDVWLEKFNFAQEWEKTALVFGYA
jgi:outer membrane murein-binding lipoprotein Lpp